MNTLFNARELGIFRQVASFFPHTYTRTPVTAGTQNAAGNTPRVLGTAVAGLAGHYRSEETLRTDEGGRTTIYRPNLTVAHDSPLAVGDLVSAIADGDGVMLVAGPLLVESIVPVAVVGPTLTKRAYLRAGDAR